MKFCPSCAHPLTQRIPEGDDRPRAVCESCGEIHYVNPRSVVGCLVEAEGQLLLCRRAIEPSRGRWTVPAGFLELGESLRDGAARETREEACAEVEIFAPQAMLELFHIGQVYVLFRARLLPGADGAPDFAAGDESLEVGLFDPDDLPLGELAFPVVHYALELYRADLERGRHRLHQANLSWNGEGSRFDPKRYELRDHVALELDDSLGR